jgi:hypothetical protein
MNVGDLYSTRSGDTVWIAGSDPSLSEYPDDFFDGKTAITLHLAHRKFPNATFRYSSEYDRSEHLISVDPEYRSKPLIAALPMYGKTEKETRALLANFADVHFHRMVSYPPNGIRGEVDPRFTEWKVRRTMAGKARIWGGHGTCLHTAIYMAILLGASRIALIGCGHGLYKPGEEHFGAVEKDHHEMRPGYRSFADPVEHVPLIEQTLALADACRANGIGFDWYRTWNAGMTDTVTISEEWLAEEKRRAKRHFGLTRRIYWALLKRPLNNVLSRM